MINISFSFKGWTPSTFTSTRKKTDGASKQNRPEDFMDDEVLIFELV